MELSKEFIESNSLNAEQVTAIQDFGRDQIADAKQGFEGLANTNAEKILDGAATYTMEKLGIKDFARNDGEKIGDFMGRLSTSHFGTRDSELSKLKIELDKKIKEGGGDDKLKDAYAELETKLDDLNKKTADYDLMKENSEKYEGANKELGGLKLSVAFGEVKPNFPDTVNAFEASARWEAFKSEVLEKHTITIVDGKPMAVSKENEHSIKPLADLLKKDDEITKLMEGRKQDGFNPKDKDTFSKIKGVPFDVPDGVDSGKKAVLIRKYLKEQLNLDSMDVDYPKKFAEINKNILIGEKETA